MPGESALLRIELHNLSKAYLEGEGPRWVLQGINWRFTTGRFYALRGRSGSGKTTLLNLIAGLDEPTSGEVRIGRRSLSTMDSSARAGWRRQQVGFVFQFFHLLPTLSARENIALAAELAGVPWPAALAQAEDWLERVGLGDRGEEFPDRLSGGEQQRVAIARALIHSPRWVLADEPTGNLDRATGDEILGQLRELVRSQHATLILATHSHSVAARADQTLVLQDGRLKAGTRRRPTPRRRR